ncbi:MAG: shikimate dehydrogenase [Eubacterium sp.]|nr:shikimate dehydrogenase [Eubacterium sp.]SEG11216.1 shikimate dehydrogenase [Eubacterium ruminantium]
MSEISGTTILTGLLGSPVKHSKSPLMHNKAFELLDLDYRYLCFEVDTTTLKTAVEGLRTIGVRGFNLTMPNKNLMCELCDKLDIGSEISGAVNTVVNDNGVFTGYTTDGIGFMRAAADAGHILTGKKMVLLGAGGVASAILVQAALDNVAQIKVFSLRDQFYGRAENIVSQLNDRTSCKVYLNDFSDESKLKEAIAEADILVNGTSVGMAPKVDGCIIKDEMFKDSSVFRPSLVVSDVIYEPQETKLLRLAKEVGCQTFNGMYMLLYQGAESFKLWTGKEMPTDTIKKLFFS